MEKSTTISKSAFVALRNIGIISDEMIADMSVSEFTVKREDRETELVTMGPKKDYSAEPADRVSFAAGALARVIQTGLISKEEVADRYIVRAWTSKFGTEMVTLESKDAAQSEDLDAILEASTLRTDAQETVLETDAQQPEQEDTEEQYSVADL